MVQLSEILSIYASIYSFFWEFWLILIDLFWLVLIDAQIRFNQVLFCRSVPPEFLRSFLVHKPRLQSLSSYCKFYRLLPISLFYTSTTFQGRLGEILSSCEFIDAGSMDCVTQVLQWCCNDDVAVMLRRWFCSDVATMMLQWCYDDDVATIMCSVIAFSFKVWLLWR